jgi:hypothetical protein
MNAGGFHRQTKSKTNTRPRRLDSSTQLQLYVNGNGTTRYRRWFCYS